jgi:hypothetical protein
MGDLSIFFYFFKEKIMFDTQLIKSNHRVLRRNKADTYGAPDYGATFLASKIGINPLPMSILSTLYFYDLYR